MKIEVISRPGVSTGRLHCDGLEFECALGRAGILSGKREGDGATPLGTFALRQLRYRPDRIAKPVTALETIAILLDDGWCDAPEDPAYNQPVKLPYKASAENMWREDGLYDAVVMLGYNDAPVIPGMGSAIFMHVAGEDDTGLNPTEGCVALRLPDLLQVAARCNRDSHITITQKDD